MINDKDPRTKPVMYISIKRTKRAGEATSYVHKFYMYELERYIKEGNMLNKRNMIAGDEEVKENMGWSQVMEEATVAAALCGARRGRKQAARAYDEAACLLRGANTRTNFWPCSLSSKSVLPSKITNLLLLRLKARNNNVNASTTSMVTTSPVSLQVQETANAIEDHTRNSQFDDFFNVPEDCTVNTENSDSATFTTSTTTITSDCMMDCFNTSFSTCAEDNWSNVDGNNNSHEEEKKLEGEVVEEEIDTEVMDFGFVDDLGKSCHCSPFEIAEEIMKPMHEDYQTSWRSNQLCGRISRL
ncbi:uncharacterized protein LOC116146585 [Pistacia vera]|uniref:uncharacterized protein LOC116146585 n=1 Tax=Pistacia vera TaxID=55513 RepID=UPI001262BDAA|nr:uncharacterized protein LOC116146585 [Pistacia vera]